MSKQRRVLAIGGVPCTGKTTLIKRFMKESGLEFQPKKINKLLDVMYNEEKDLYIFGKYDLESDEVFQGTDKLSMAVQPKVVEFIQSIDKGNILFEGDRIFNKSMLEFFSNELTDEEYFRILILSVGKDALDERHIIREDNQPEKFLKSRVTKINRIVTNMDLRQYIIEVDNTTEERQKKLVSFIRCAFDLHETSEERILTDRTFIPKATWSIS